MLMETGSEFNICGSAVVSQFEITLPDCSKRSFYLPLRSSRSLRETLKNKEKSSR
jgi:hypothetical protein